MINLKTTKTYTVADNDTVKSILIDAFEQTIDVFVAIVRLRKNISRKEHSDSTQIFINCPERLLDYYQDDFHNELKNQLNNLLELNNDEYVQFGDVKHAYNIGNNCEYPIQIVTKDQIIDFGRLKSNTDIYCNRKHISLADNDGQNINNKRVQLNAA